MKLLTTVLMAWSNYLLVSFDSTSPSLFKTLFMLRSFLDSMDESASVKDEPPELRSEAASYSRCTSDWSISLARLCSDGLICSGVFDI